MRTKGKGKGKGKDKGKSKKGKGGKEEEEAGKDGYRGTGSSTVRWSFAVARKLTACTQEGLSHSTAMARLNEAMDVIPQATFVYSSPEAARNGRKSLLALWEWLLSPRGERAAAHGGKSPAVGQTMRMNALSALLRRGEWSLDMLDFSKTLEPIGSEVDIAVAVQYRDMLVTTFELAVGGLEGQFGTRLSPAEASFCARTLAVSFFSIPNVCGYVILAVDPTEAEAQDAAEWGASLGERDGGGEEVVEDAEYGYDSAAQERARAKQRAFCARETASELTDLVASDKMLASSMELGIPRDLVVYPYLFKGLPGSGVEPVPFDQSAPWLGILGRRTKMFMIFVRELILHIRRVYHRSVGPSGRAPLIPWMLIPGMPSIVSAVCYEIRTRDLLARPDGSHDSATLEATKFVLLNPYLLSTLIREQLACIGVENIPLVGHGLDVVGTWLTFAMSFHHKTTLYNTFDASFLIQALDTLLGSDRYAVCGKALSFIAEYEGAFQGEARISLLGNILLRKYFFSLFLHWCSTVRRLFHIVLLYHIVDVRETDALFPPIVPKASFATPASQTPVPRPHWESYLTSGLDPTKPEHAVHTVLASKLFGYLTMMDDLESIPSDLRVYAPLALQDFEASMATYDEWRASSNPVPPVLAYKIDLHLPRLIPIPGPAEAGSGAGMDAEFANQLDSAIPDPSLVAPPPRRVPKDSASPPLTRKRSYSG